MLYFMVNNILNYIVSRNVYSHRAVGRIIAFYRVISLSLMQSFSVISANIAISH